MGSYGKVNDSSTLGSREREKRIGSLTKIRILSYARLVEAWETLVKDAAINLEEAWIWFARRKRSRT